MTTRRTFIGGMLLGSAVKAAHSAMVMGEARNEAAPAAELWSRDAGEVSVGRGPWAAPTDLPSDLHFESLLLRMPDGVRLAALLFLPVSVRAGQLVPALLEEDPYRHEPRMGSTGRTGELARRGFAEIYLDVRGTGGSEGIPSDEYSVDEHQDTLRVIDWLSRQPWSNGNVGMYGISYSAFNSVQIAAEFNPAPLKAIFVLAGTDNRYTDDIHYPGGSMLMIDNSWALGMVTSNATPAAPEFDLASKAALERWNTPPWLQVFLEHQTDGPHWRRGSLAPDYGRLKTPTFLGGGYLDIYQNFVPRIMRNSPAITRGVLGPWHHSMSWPGPVLDWEALRVRWFDHWLKGSDTGILREPRVSFFMPTWQRQTFRYRGAVPGEWRYLDEWPETVVAPSERLYLRPTPELPTAAALQADPAPGSGGMLSQLSGTASALRLRYYPARGGTTLSFGPTGGEGYYGIDARDENVYGLCFDTPPLREPVEILGFARARLFASSTAPVANWIVQLCDLAPDGTSYIVTRGCLNGTHRTSHTDPSPLVPGEVYELPIELMCTGYRFPAGHCIRVVVTNAEFPLLWPSPYPMVTTLFTGADRPSFIELPVLRPQRYLSGRLPVLREAVDASSVRSKDGVTAYQLTRDYASSTTTAAFKMGDDQLRCRVDDNNPAVAALQLSASVVHTPEGAPRRIETRAEGTLSSDAGHFTMDIECVLLENGREVRRKRWQHQVARKLV